MNSARLNLLRLFFAALSFGMIYIVVITSLKSNLFEVLPQLNEYPWFNTTIIDFYFNVAIISAWVIYKEKSIFVALLWIVSFVLLGSISTAFYVLVQLMKLKPQDSFEQALLKNG